MSAIRSARAGVGSPVADQAGVRPPAVEGSSMRDWLRDQSERRRREAGEDERCRYRCGNYRMDSHNTDWAAYDCYRECRGLPPVKHPLWDRGARSVGRRFAEEVVRRGGSQDLAYELIYGIVTLIVAIPLLWYLFLS